MGGWGDFLGDMQRFYGVKLDCLNDEFRQEQQEYFMSTSAWADIHPSQLLGPPACFKHYDLLTVTLEEIAAPLQVWYSLPYTITDIQQNVCVALTPAALPDWVSAPGHVMSLASETCHAQVLACSCAPCIMLVDGAFL